MAAAFTSLFCSRAKLHHEILILRHQINVLRRATPKHVSLPNVDRLLLVWSYRIWLGVLGAVCVLRPETIVRWHRQGFRAYWRWRSRALPGRPKVPKEARDLIREISLANANYYNGSRTHLSLAKDTPLGRAVQPTGQVRRVPHLGGLHYSFARI